MEETNLWVEVGNECLLRALTLLKSETAPTAATAETARTLIDAAVSMAEINHRLEHENQVLSGVQVFPGNFS